MTQWRPIGHVVADHDMTIDLGSFADNRIAVTAAIDDRIGSDFHVILHDDAAELNDLMVTTRTHRKPEPVRTETYARLDDDAIYREWNG